jgi:hypothetical protein
VMGRSQSKQNGQWLNILREGTHNLETEMLFICVNFR